MYSYKIKKNKNKKALYVDLSNDQQLGHQIIEPCATSGTNLN